MPTTTSTDDQQQPDEHSRRRLLRLLLALGIGIPVAIELSTFLGLLTGERGDGAADIGDELLPESPQAETLLDSSVYEGPPRQYELVVGVENSTETAAELVVGPLFTDAGTRVAGTERIEVPAGERRELTARWELDSGAMPGAVRARATWNGEETTDRVQLARPAVYSGAPAGADGTE
jgi:hypothetical protein